MKKSARQPSRIFARLNLVFALLFFVAAAIQFNDPDPLAWFAMYLAAGVVSLVYTRLPKGRMLLPAVIGLTALIWSLAIIRGMIEDPLLADLVRPMEAGHPEIEEGREAIGLLMITAWMTVLCVRDTLGRENGK